jgi:hypothetical protein
MKTVPMLGTLCICTIVYLVWFMRDWKRRKAQKRLNKFKDWI